MRLPDSPARPAARRPSSPEILALRSEYVRREYSLRRDVPLAQFICREPASTLFDWGGTEKYPLEITYPLPAGSTFATTVDTNNRCGRAYPGLSWSINIAAIGGVFPYLYEKVNGPADLTVGAFTGLVTWANPTTAGSPHSVTVRVTDTKGTSLTTTWSITVTTSNTFFVDSLNGTAHTSNGGSNSLGNFANPWRSLKDAWFGSTANSIVYFRGVGSAYTLTGFSTSDGSVTTGGTAVDNRIHFSSSSRSVIWLAYPGDPQPVIDLESNGTNTPAIRPGGPHIHFDGLKFYRGFNKTIWVDRTSRRGAQFRNCTWDTFGPPVLASSNSAGLMYTALYGSGDPNTQAYGDVIIGCTFINPVGDMPNFSTELTVAIKQYSWYKGLIQGCTLTQTLSANVTGWYEAISQKSNCTQCTVRTCTLTNASFGGNFHTTSVGDNCSVEVCFNYIDFPTGNGLHYFHSRIETYHGVYTYRNTLRTRMLIDALQAADGPVTLEQNVIVNQDGAETPWRFVQDTAIVSQTPLTLNIPSNPSLTPTGVQNLAGASADNIISNGLLIEPYRTPHLYLRGHEVPT